MTEQKQDMLKVLKEFIEGTLNRVQSKNRTFSQATHEWIEKICDTQGLNKEEFNLKGFYETLEEINQDYSCKIIKLAQRTASELLNKYQNSFKNINKNKLTNNEILDSRINHEFPDGTVLNRTIRECMHVILNKLSDEFNYENPKFFDKNEKYHLFLIKKILDELGFRGENELTNKYYELVACLLKQGQ